MARYQKKQENYKKQANKKWREIKTNQKQIAENQKKQEQIKKQTRKKWQEIKTNQT